MAKTQRAPQGALQPACVDGCAPEPWEAWSSQPARGWLRFFGGSLPPSEITARAIGIVGCPCRLEQLLRLPGLAGGDPEHQLMHAAREKWRDEVEAELEQMAKVEQLLRDALAAADDALGLEYGLRITHAAEPRYEGDQAINEPLERPIDISMRDALTLFAERLKEDAARRRGNTDERGLHMSRPGNGGQRLRFTACSPQDRLIGKDDELSRSLLTDAVTSSRGARSLGEHRSAYAEINRQQVAALGVLGWNRGEIADLIMASCHEWRHPPTDLASRYRYETHELTSDDPKVKGDAIANRDALIKWLKNHDPRRTG